MTLVPSSLLPHRAVARPYQGPSAYGPVYGSERPKVRCRIDGKRRRVLRPGGVEVISSASMVVRPRDVLPVESQVDHRGRTYEVVEVLAGEGLTGRPALYELVLA